MTPVGGKRVLWSLAGVPRGVPQGAFQVAPSHTDWEHLTEHTPASRALSERVSEREGLLRFSEVFRGPNLKGPFRTKNAMAPKAVVLYYCHSILLCALTCCHFPQEKQRLQTFCRSESLWP